MPAIHQFHPNLVPGDGVSNNVFALQRLFRSWGYEAHAYAVHPHASLEPEARSYRRLFRAVKPDDLLLLHYSMGDEVFRQLVKIPARRVLVYHNITPPEFFTGISPQAALLAELGLRRLREIAPHVELAVADSEFNRQGLEAAGFERTTVVPLLVDWSVYDTAPDQRVLAAWTPTRTRLLFVGRIAPNKRQDDLIRLLAYYRRLVDDDTALLLVGTYRDQPQYHARLVALVRALGQEATVSFTGSVSPSALVAYYRLATCFVSLSEHEGFGVPLLEAMHFGVPVVAYAAAAVAETADGAALLLPDRDLAQAAEACALVAERADVRERLVAAGRRRVADFATERVAERMRTALGL